MNREKATHVKKRFANAKKTLGEVQILIENEIWNTSVNRLYYACFYAVTALLLSSDLETKTHSGAQRLFELHFVRTGIIDKELSRFYTRLFDMKQSADYEDEVEYDREDVQKLIQPATRLIAEIELVLTKND
jgi:uncharacterized protein (UPF0332 family)